MKQTWFIILFTFPFLCNAQTNATDINAQKLYTKDRKTYINNVLSDTGMGNGYLITFKVKSLNSDSIYTYIISNEILFYDLNKVKKWNGEKYVKEMSKYLLYDKAFYAYEIDSSFINRLLPVYMDSCKSIYNNLSVDSLINTFKLKNEENPSFACLIILLMVKNVYVALDEEHIVLRIPPEYQKW